MKFAAWMYFHLESRKYVDEYIEKCKSYVQGHEFVICEDIDSIKKEIVDTDVMIGWRITPEVFECAKNLKWIQFGSAGVDHTLFPELVNSSVIITTLGGINETCVAEHVISLMLALARRLDCAITSQNQKKYDRKIIADTADELFGKTLGIVGLGRIGLRIAHLAKAFGMNVVGTKKTVVSSLPNVDEVYAAQDLKKILPMCDYLVLVLPLTDSSKHLIGKDEINLMKDGARIINVARGIMLDHEALNDALISGKLKGAALDVFPKEPLEQDSPIFDFPNTIITPHTGASNPYYGQRAFDIFKQNFDAFVNCGQMINVYDREKGY